MKKYFYIIAAILIAMAGFYSCGDPERDDTNNLGNGSPNNPFKVATVADLKRVGSGETGPEGLVWARDKHYKQIADIDLSDESNWTPICGIVHGSWFTGKYDGGGYTISNLTIFGNENDRGLFGTVFGTITNVRLYKVSISGSKQVGSIAGTLQSKGTIEHCSVSNIEIWGKWYTGGLVGNICNNAIVNACIVTGGMLYGIGTPKVDAIIGGVAGNNSGTIKNCYATVNVEGLEYIGGIAGTSNGTIQYCYATGNVIKKDRGVGGIAGKNTGSGKIQYCVALNREVKREVYSSGSGTPTIGRITGENINSATTTNNYARIDMALKNGTEDVPFEATLTGIHGADVEAINYHGDNSGTWWSSTAGFPPSEWSFDNNRLPWLKGFEGLVQNPTVKN